MKIYICSHSRKWSDEPSDANLLAETKDNHYKWGSLIQINGQIYSACCGLSIKEKENEYKWVEVEPLETYNIEKGDIEDAENNTWQTEKLTCPVCGYVDEDSWEIGDGDDNYKCPRCGSSLSVEVEYSKTFTVTCNEPNKNILKVEK